MARDHLDLLETHIDGPDTKLWSVRAEECPALTRRHIAHVGLGDAAVPYRIVRTKLSGAYLHGSLGGEGRMLIDGRWRPHAGGMASLAPAHVLHAFHAIPSRRWNYCWVRFTPTSPRSIIHAMAPIVGRFDCRPLGHAIMGLYDEMQGRRDIATCALWLDLIETYVDAFAEPWRRETRLVAVWNSVRQDLARPWTLAELASLAGLSGEHLRRLCHGSLGRSPMQQLTNLRVQHAAHQLVTTDAKIETIADSVGYRNAFAFSNVFKKVTGVRPSHFRTRRQP
ncbi:AraC family transcriptional regulator [uncultured Enterovirga sp.]|uniref:helix-turn-helix transcriptional regulator n=1 Tax=uncultured Enterovirga sp. TaxID=2026352 RepID=UPI0035CB9CBF